MRRVSYAGEGFLKIMRRNLPNSVVDFLVSIIIVTGADALISFSYKINGGGTLIALIKIALHFCRYLFDIF